LPTSLSSTAIYKIFEIGHRGCAEVDTTREGRAEPPLFLGEKPILPSPPREGSLGGRRKKRLAGVITDGG